MENLPEEYGGSCKCGDNGCFFDSPEEILIKYKFTLFQIPIYANYAIYKRNHVQNVLLQNTNFRRPSVKSIGKNIE